MLVLKCKVGQEVVIDGGRIRVMVCSMDRRGSVKLGFEAPKEVVVDRSKVHQMRTALRA